MSLTVLRDGSEHIHYRDPSIPFYVSKGDLRTFPNMTALCHWHEDVEFLMSIHGHLTYNVNGTLVTIEEGDAIFVNARHLHYGFSADGTDCDYVCVTFRPQLLCVNEEITNRYVMPVLTSPHFSYLILRQTKTEHQPMLTLLSRICSIYQTPMPGIELEELGYLFHLWKELHLLAASYIDSTPSTDTNILIQKQMLEFIRTHYQERITVDSIAAAGGVCRTKCCQIFRQYLDRTPNDYLNSFRLEQGMELLKSTKMTVAEIAELCGFSSSSYFTEMFTKHKGFPPKEYRKMNYP